MHLNTEEESLHSTMVQRKQQVTSARSAPVNKNKHYSTGPLPILCLMLALELQVNCHSHQFHPTRMPPQLKQMQASPSQQQFASEASLRFASVQPMISNPFAQHSSSRLTGASPASLPSHQAGWSHVLRPSPWFHFAKNLVAAPITIGAMNRAPSARLLSLPTDQWQQRTVAGPQVATSATLPTHQRASPGQPNPALVQSLRPAAAETSSRPAIAQSSAPATRSQGATRSSRSAQQHLRDGKLLICYYATKHTAPYWPADGREFVVPADHFEQTATDFFAANHHQNQPAPSQPPQATSLASSEANRANDEQAVDSSMSSAGAQLKQRRSIFASKAGGNGARLVVIAPNLVPASFNQSIGAKSDGGNAATQLASRPASELGIDRADSMGQMFHQAANNNNRRRTITERNDLLLNGNNNGATLAINSAPANQSIGKQLAPLQGESNLQAASTQNNAGQTGNNNVVFIEHNLHDLNNNRQVGGGGGGSLAFLGDANAGLEVQQQKLGASLIGGRRQPLLLQSARLSTTLNPTSRNGGPSLSPTAPPQTEGPIQNRNSVPDLLPINSSEQLNQFYYYYNLPTVGPVSGQGWKNPAFSVGVAPTSGPGATQSTLGTNRFKAVTFPQSIHLGGSQAQQGKSLQVPEANLDELNRPTQAGVSMLGSSVTSGTSAGPSGNPLWPSSPSSSQPTSSSSSSSLAMSNSATTKPSSSLVFSRQPPPERHQASNRPKQVSIAGNSFSLEGQRYLSSAPVEGADSTGSMRLVAPSGTPPDPHEASLAESLSLSKTTPAMSSSSLPAGSGFFSSPVMERPLGPTLSQHSQQHSIQHTTTGKLAEESTPLLGANNRNFREPAEPVKPASIGLGGNSLSASLVSSPLSTMFDVFGAASQYLMRLRPSSLISPASFAAFNSIGEYNSHHNGANKGRALNSSLSSSSSSSPLSSLVSSFGSSKGHSDQRTTAAANRSAASLGEHKPVGGGLLSRLSLQLGQNQPQRREEICGRTIQTPERRIIGGEGAKYGEFPYQVHIKIAKHQCGGALIDRQSIVTAAHCVYHFITRAPVNKLQIVIGAYDIEDEQYQELPPQYFKVNKVKLHPNFRFSASHPDRYDVAILKLDKPVKYTDNVLPVCLPGKELKYDNMVGTVTGFGKTDPSLSNRYGTRLLQKVDVPIIENSECERWHRTRGIDLKIFPEMMCAGYEDGLKDACVGDSGGPLVVKTPTGSNGSFRWTLAGITSAGFGCAQSRQPGIYHRVSHTVDWILDNLD